MSRYRFGPFELDAESGTLQKFGSRLRLQKQPFQILLTLIERSGEVVSRSELRQTVWGDDTFVDFEHGINAAVNKIRRTLGDSSDHAIYIKTLPGEGYRFVGAIARQAVETTLQEPLKPQAAPFAARSLWRAFAAAGAAIIGLFTLGSFTLHKELTDAPKLTDAAKLTDKDTVVLADFTNSTGDAEFDDMLREALAIQLEESPFLKVLGDDRVGEDLQLMRQPPGTMVTNGLAREICQRENEKAVIHGSIANLGRTFSITLQATDCQSGDVLAREQAKAPDKERALEALAAAAKGLRAKLGESLTSIRQASPPGERVTTTSLAAFRTFALGVSLFRRGNYTAAIPVFQHAVELDPEFSTAWLYLGISYQMSGDSGTHLSDGLKRAFEMPGGVSEREHLFVASLYYFYVMRDWEKARASSELFSHLYPRNDVAENLWGNILGQKGNLEDALREYQRADELGNTALVKSNLARALVRLNRFDDATAFIRKEFAHNPDNTGLHHVSLQIALMQSDEISAGREMQWFSMKPAEYLSLETQAANAFVRGQRRRQQQLLREASQTRTRLSLAVPVSSTVDEDALSGACESTRRGNEAGAVALTLCGDDGQITASLKNAKRAAAARPYDADIALAKLLAAAASDLSHNHPAEAIEQLRSLSSIERRHPEVIYLRGLACLQLHKNADAAAEFRKIVDHKGTYWGPYYPVSYVALARSEALAGDMPKARQAYRDFFALWREADPDIPILRKARFEYAALR